jgi:hypothetical protein
MSQGCCNNSQALSQHNSAAGRLEGGGGSAAECRTKSSINKEWGLLHSPTEGMPHVDFVR